MKKVTLLSLALLVFFMFSCKSDDDDGDKVASGSVTFDGDSYSLTNGFMIDFGADGGFYNIDFTTYDGSLNIGEEKIEGSVEIYAELFAPGTSFSTGTFEYLSFFDDPEPGDYFFNSSYITIDSDDDGEIDSNDDSFSATGGTIMLSGSGSNYTITYDLTFANSMTLTGSVSGKFQEINF